MTKITAIKETKRGRFALFSEEEFLFSVDGETLAKSGLSVGDTLAPTELEDLRAQSDTRKAKDQALRYLAQRLHGEQELYKKLCLRYDENSSAAAVALMRELALVNDAEFAAEKARSMARRGKSPLEIKAKLASLGLDRELAEEAVAALGIDEAAAAQALVQKQYMTKLQNGQRENVMAALARRGFSHRDIITAVQLAERQLAALEDA